MTLEETLARLEALGSERMREQNRRHGAGDNQFGVMLGDIRKLAKEIKAGHELALALWETGNSDARLLAILLFKPALLTADDLERMIAEVGYAQVAEWLTSYVIGKHPEREALRLKWLDSADPWAARAAWGLTSERISKSPDTLDLPALLERIEREMPGAPPQVQWTMNFCLAGIGINSPELRPRTITFGENLGLYRDYPVSKGCISPFAPIWINEMVKRQG